MVFCVALPAGGLGLGGLARRRRGVRDGVGRGLGRRSRRLGLLRGGARRLQRRAIGRLAQQIDGLDVEVTIGVDEFEHRLHRGEILLAAQRRAPGQIGLLRFEIGEQRNVGDLALHGQRAEPRQFAQQPRRLVALGVELRPSA